MSETACLLLQPDAAMAGRSWSVHAMGHVQATCPEPVPAPPQDPASWLPPLYRLVVTLIPCVLLADAASSEATLVLFQGLAWPSHHHGVHGDRQRLLPPPLSLRGQTRVHRLRFPLKAEENLKLFQPKVSLNVNKSCQKHLMEERFQEKGPFLLHAG